MEDETISDVNENTQNFDFEENKDPEIEGQDFVAQEEQPDPYAEKNKQLYARAKAAEDELKDLKSKSEPQKPTEQPKPTNNSDSDERIARLELMVKGYSEPEIDFIQRNGGQEALGNELVQAAIGTMREKRKSEDANQSIGTKSPMYKRHTIEEMKNMSREDLEKIIPR